MSSTRTYTPFPYTTLFRSKVAALNPGASGPKPMKKTDGMRLRPTSRTYRHFRTAFVLSTRMATATLAGNRHRSIGTDRRRDKLMSEYAAEAARRDAEHQKQNRKSGGEGRRGEVRVEIGG